MSTPVQGVCPRCLQYVNLTEYRAPDGERYWKCTDGKCGFATIPQRYTSDYQNYPPIPFAIMGTTGSGKTRYLVSLFKQLETIKEYAMWPDFFSNPLDVQQHDRLIEKLESYESGQSEEATRLSDIPEPMVIRYGNIPRVGGCQLIYFDNAGEAFDDNTRKFRASNHFMRNTNSIVWLMSLREPPEYGAPHEDVPPRNLARMLTIYLQGLTGMGGDAKKQTLVLALTKGERLEQLPRFPQSGKDILQLDLTDLENDPWALLLRVNHDLDKWMLTTKYAGLLNQLKSEFAKVRICVVSAQGREIDPEDTGTALEPKAVLSPLYWLWRQYCPGIWVKSGDKESFHLSISDALKSGLTPGSTIRLEKGIYYLPEPVTVKVPVAIVGEGPGVTIITGQSGACLLQADSSGEIRLENLSMQRYGPLPGDVVRVTQGALVARNVHFSGAVSQRSSDGKMYVSKEFGHSLWIGEYAQAKITSCQFQGDRKLTRAGIFVKSMKGTVVIEDCSGNSNDIGILAEGSSRVMVTGGVWEKGGHGIRVTDQAKLEAKRVQCISNTAGILVKANAEGKFENCTMNSNRQHGVKVTDDAMATIFGGQFMGCNVGIAVNERATIEISNSSEETTTIADNAVDGLVFEDSSKGRAEGLILSGNGRYGFALTGQTTACCSDLKTFGNKKAGGFVAKSVTKAARVEKCQGVIDERSGGGWFKK